MFLKDIKVPIFSILKHIFETCMAFSLPILKNPIPFLAVTLTVILYNAFSGYGFLSTLFTISFVSISSIVLNFSKQKLTVAKALISATNETEPFSENESIGHSSITDHDSENDWPCAVKKDCSDDGSISDEESLIEIALPSGFKSHSLR